MRDIDFGKGRVFHINNGFDLRWAPELSEEIVRKDLLQRYESLMLKHYRECHKSLGLKYTEYIQDEEKIIECLFLDVEELGEDKILKAMEEFEMIMAYAGCGMPVPGGTLPWE